MRKNKKHSLSFKQRIVEEIRDGISSVHGQATEHSLAHSMVRRWYRQFEAYGIEGLTSKPYTHYSASFKLEVLHAISAERLSLMDAIIRFNLPNQSVIVNWREQFHMHGIEGLKSKPKGRPRMKQKDKLSNKGHRSVTNPPLTTQQELLKENEYLRAEIALLKKLQALVQKDNKRKP